MITFRIAPHLVYKKERDVVEILFDDVIVAVIYPDANERAPAIRLISNHVVMNFYSAVPGSALPPAWHFQFNPDAAT